MKKVLIIAYYFPPMGLSGVQRTLKFVKYLPHYGWHPVVLTTNAPAYYAYDESMLDELDNENTTIYRTDEDITKFAKKAKNEKTTINYPSRFTQLIRRFAVSVFLQPDSRILWKKLALKTAEKIFEENNIEAIYSTAPPFTDFLVAENLSKKYNIPYIIDYRDLWVDNAFYIYPTPFHKLYSIFLERRVLEHSSKAIVINRFMKESLLKRYPKMSHDDISIIPHGFDPMDFESASKTVDKNNKFVVTHSGLFPDDLTPEYFLKGVREFLKKNPNALKDLELRFIGVMRKEHINLINKLELNDICILTGYIPHLEAVKNLLESDVLWMMITNNIATPSRMYEYFGAQKPLIVCAPEGNIKELAESSDNVMTTSVGNVEEIALSLKKYYDLWKDNDMKITKKGFIEQYDRKKLTAQLSKELLLSIDN